MGCRGQAAGQRQTHPVQLHNVQGNIYVKVEKLISRMNFFILLNSEFFCATQGLPKEFNVDITGSAAWLTLSCICCSSEGLGVGLAVDLWK